MPTEVKSATPATKKTRKQPVRPVLQEAGHSRVFPGWAAGTPDGEDAPELTLHYLRSLVNSLGAKASGDTRIELGAERTTVHVV